MKTSSISCASCPLSCRGDSQGPDTAHVSARGLVPQSNSQLFLSSLRETMKSSDSKTKILPFPGCQEKDSQRVYT